MAVKVSSKGKRTFSVVLDAEKGEFVREWLGRSGGSLSKFLSVSVNELYQGIKDAELVNADSARDSVEYLAAVAGVMRLARKSVIDEEADKS
jgi:hypothetical protein